MTKTYDIEHPINDLAQECLADSALFFPEIHVTPRKALVHFTLGLAGEAGEVANLVKKGNRGSMGWEEVAQLLRHELADVLIYLLDIAAVLDIDIEQAVAEKREVNRERWG
jgi:NTP pyrophosphatase (non-canonical NTP hydrolase)